MAWVVGPDHVLRPCVPTPSPPRRRPLSGVCPGTTCIGDPDRDLFLRAVIARHHPSQIGRPPTGLIQVVVPYDGEQCFSRKAYRDVRQQYGRTAPRDAEALVGHLTLLETGRTDLANVLDLSGSFESVPLLLPATMGDLTYPYGLRADRHACVIEYTYRPDDPKLIPVDVNLRISDDEGEAPSGRSAEGRARRLGASGQFRPRPLRCASTSLSCFPTGWSCRQGRRGSSRSRSIGRPSRRCAACISPSTATPSAQLRPCHQQPPVDRRANAVEQDAPLRLPPLHEHARAAGHSSARRAVPTGQPRRSSRDRAPQAACSRGCRRDCTTRAGRKADRAVRSCRPGWSPTSVLSSTRP